jgi:high-affinity Fe2+/Pb2+ permease
MAVVLLVLWVISLIPNPVMQFWVSRLYGPGEYSHFVKSITAIASVHVILCALLNIGVGVWLFVLAQKYNATPWLWLVYGLFFGVIAAVLFYLVRIHDALNLDGKKPDASPKL